MIKVGIFLGQFPEPGSDNPQCGDCGTELEVDATEKPIKPDDNWYCGPCSWIHTFNVFSEALQKP